jgi:amidase/aspartyl-tRNA(Asn)/glutamyl-tRNA(Gln) amidotransferase subunit A
MLDVMAGPHAEDVFALPDDGTDYRGSVRDSVVGLDVAFSPDLDVFPVADEVSEIVADAVRAFERVDATVEETEVGFERSQEELCATWMAWVDVSRATSSELLAHDGIDLLGAHREELHPELVASIERGLERSALEHGLTDTVRTEVADAVRSLFDRYDLLVAPTLAVPPVENAENGYTTGPSAVDGEAVDPHLGWCLTYPFNFTGHPAASIPAGFTDDGLPVGLQIVGPRFAEDRVLAASAAFERVRPWADSYPSL